MSEPGAVIRPDAVEIALDGCGVVRGLRWPGSDRAMILLHAPGGDLDDWRDLPATITSVTGFSALALDLPGCGMSDEPAAPWSVAALLAAAGAHLGLPPSRCMVAAAGETAIDTLAMDPMPPIAGLIALAPAAGATVSRSPRLSKLLFAAATEQGQLQQTRELANRAGGWAIVSAITPGDNDPWLLDGPWGVHVREQAAAFARDCLNR